ncbi:MAG TPA: PQQ-binding-like beta-propeller repeat protein, partial [Pyrinomonadaceae bacterium]|nr:PQQ-binding-like beta-propeller repeat protein [Pyrinomonadaceae bacterium]
MKVFSFPRGSRRAYCLLPIICALGFISGCTSKAVTETPPPKVEPPKPPPTMSFWLGNPERNFYGTGPWKDGQLKIAWEVKTGFISGRFHKDPWGGTSWPGQPSVEGDFVYFPSADGNTYCIRRDDGTVVWKFQAKDSMKATPVIVGDRIIDSGLDHHVYCLNKKDGTLIWDYETGFEVDGSVVVIDDKLYFGGEDHSLYCLTLADGKLVYKIPDVGSVEGSITYKDGRIYLSTEQFYLYCFNAADGKV